MLMKVYHVAKPEIPVEMYEIDAKNAIREFPDEWFEKSADAAKAKGAGKKDKEPAVPVPAADPKGPFEAKAKGAGWWAIFDADGKEVGKSMREDDAAAFNSLTDDEKLEYAKAELAKD